MNREQERLLSLARSQVITHPEVAVCWDFVVEGIKHRYLGLENLPEMIAALARGGSRGYDEIDFDWSLDEEDTIVLTFVSAEYTCPGKLLIAELERLLRRYRGEPDPGPAEAGGGTGHSMNGSHGSDSNSGEAAATDSGADMLDFMAGLLGTTPDVLAGGDAAGLRRRFAVLGDEVKEISEALGSQEPGAHERARKRAEALRTRLQEEGITGARRLDEIKGQIANAAAKGRELDTEALGSALHVLADWLQGKGQDAGGAVDALVAMLERVVGPLLPGGNTDKETISRIHQSARTSIAARLREAGLEPGAGKRE